MDHPCSHMCLQGGAHKDHVKGYRCVCPTGYALKEGSTTQCADGEEGFYLQHLLIYISLLYRYIFLNCSQRGLTSLLALPSPELSTAQRGWDKKINNAKGILKL